MRERARQEENEKKVWSSECSAGKKKTEGRASERDAAGVNSKQQQYEEKRGRKKYETRLGRNKNVKREKYILYEAK